MIRKPRTKLIFVFENIINCINLLIKEKYVLLVLKVMIYSHYMILNYIIYRNVIFIDIIEDGFTMYIIYIYITIYILIFGDIST